MTEQTIRKGYQGWKEAKKKEVADKSISLRTCFIDIFHWTTSFNGQSMWQRKGRNGLSLHLLSFFFNFFMVQPTPLFRLFLSFQTNITILTTNQCEKMSCPSIIRCRDSNPWPLECESPPITTRPGLPPSFLILGVVG